MRVNGPGPAPFTTRSRSDQQRRERRDGRPPPPLPSATRRVREEAGLNEQVRAQIAALEQAVRAGEDALAILNTARVGVAAAQGSLQRLADCLAERAKPVVLGADSAEAPQSFRTQAPGAEAPSAAVRRALAALEGLAGETRFGRLRLLDGSLGYSGASLGDGLTFVSAGERTRSSPPQGYEVRLLREPVRPTLLTPAPLQVPGDAETLELGLRAGGSEVRQGARHGDDAAALTGRLREAAQQAALPLIVQLTPDGRLLVQHHRFGAAHGFEAYASLPGVFAPGAVGWMHVNNGRDIAGTLNKEQGRGEGQTLTGLPGNTTTAGLTVRYTGLPFTGRNGRLQQRPRNLLDEAVFAGRVIVASRPLVFHLEGAGQEPLRLRLDSVHPGALGRGVETADGWLSLAEIRDHTPAQAADALRVVAAAQAELSSFADRLEGAAEEQLQRALARQQVRTQNLSAVRESIGEPEAAREAVRDLNRHLLAGGSGALTAQYRPSQRTLLWLLGSEDERGPQRDTWS